MYIDTNKMTLLLFFPPCFLLLLFSHFKGHEKLQKYMKRKSEENKLTTLYFPKPKPKIQH